MLNNLSRRDALRRAADAADTGDLYIKEGTLYADWIGPQTATPTTTFALHAT